MIILGSKLDIIPKVLYKISQQALVYYKQAPMPNVHKVRKQKDVAPKERLSQSDVTLKHDEMDQAIFWKSGHSSENNESFGYAMYYIPK